MKCAAVISETRNLSNLRDIIDRHRRYLPRYFDYIAYCSDENKNAFISEGFEVRLENPIRSVEGYNAQMVSPTFWDGLRDYDRVLIFQHDSGLLREGIEMFYQWDYLGAPWPLEVRTLCTPPLDGGNGGLSLRTPEVMYRICKNLSEHQYKYQKIPEDMFFCYNLPRYGKLAPDPERRKFSVECIFMLGTFGYHDIERYHSPERVKEILNQAQELAV